jgi:hypothetical protein
MPNWCENRLEIDGPKKEISKFRQLVKASSRMYKSALSLAKLYPEPDYTKIKVKKTFPQISGKKMADPEEAWWDWRVQNWGTKWDVDAELEVKEPEHLEYTFVSAWSPPVGWLEKVSKNFPTLHFRLKYEEGGVGFMGVASGSNGDIEDNCVEYT